MYSKVSKYGPEAQRKIYQSKGKSCGYYMRIVFFFSSLIQSLIIVSLVLFLIYGKQQDSASVDRIQDLEKSFSRLSLENVELRQQRKNLTNLLNVTMIEKTRFYWEVVKLHHMTNVSIFIIEESERKVQMCNTEKRVCQFQLQDPRRGSCSPSVQTASLGCNCDLEYERLKAKLEFVDSNFTQTTTVIRREMDQIAKERDNINLEVIRLRREKAMHEKEIQFYQIKCKEDFVNTLSGVSNVSRAFLQKIESLFPLHAPFLISCPRQKEYLEQIRTNCTSLSREVEDKFQGYLNNVGDQVSNIQGENSRLTAENWRLSEDYRSCSQNRTDMMKQHKDNLSKLQQKHDDEKEKLLVDKWKLIGEQTVQENNIKFKIKEVEHLREQVKYLNMSCLPKPGFGPFTPGSSVPRTHQQSGSPWNTFGSAANSRSGFGGTGTNFGSSGLDLNKQGSTALGSSSFGSFGSTGSNPSLSSGSGLNKLGSTGLGSSNFGSSLGSLGSNPGLSSSGSGLNKLGSSGLGSSSFGSPFGSAGSNPSLSSSGSGLNKAGSSGLGSSSFGSTGSKTSLSSAGSGLNKLGSSGLGSSSFGSSFGSTGSNPSLSSAGSGLNKAGSTGLGSSSFGSSFGSTGSNPSLSSSGSGLNKAGSSGLGTSSFGSTGLNPSLSSSGTGLNKAGSSGLGTSSFGSTGSNPSLSSSGSGLNKLGGTGTGSSSFGSTGSSLNKPGSSTNSRGSSFFGSSSSSSGSTGSSSSLGSSSSKTTTTNEKSSSSSLGSSSSSSSASGPSKSNSGFSWLGFGSSSKSNADQSKSGSGTAKGSSSGSGIGSGSFGSGRSTGRTVSVAQHLQDLQRIINPPGPEESERERERQDLFRLLG